jgi:hypothetical protein
MARTRTLLATTAATVAVALLGTGLTVADTASAAKPRPKNPAATGFALKGWGYGTIARGGQVPAGSDPTAFEAIGCTDLAGKDRTNNVAGAKIPGVGTADGIKTRVWTTRSGGTVSSWAQNTIGKVTLSDSPLGTLVLTAVSTTARAFHDGSGFKATASTDLAKLQFRPPMGQAVTLDLPKPGDPIVVPGVAKVTIARSWRPANATGARAYANGLKVELIPSGTTVLVAHAVAQIGADLKSGIFAGSAYGIGGTAAGDVVQVGRNPLVKMPCQGTLGVVKQRQLAGLDLGGQVVVGASKSQQLGDQNKRRAWGWERSTVSAINIGDGALKVSGIVGQARVSRTGPHLRKMTTSTAGTTVGGIIVNGEAQDLPLDQTIEIPGVAKLEPKVVTKIRNGIQVTALRITLLDGSGAVIDLGTAKLSIRRLPTPKR